MPSAMVRVPLERRGKERGEEVRRGEERRGVEIKERKDEVT